VSTSARAGVRRETKKRQSGSKSRSLIWGTPKDGTIVVQFVRPAEELADMVDLARNYREVYCPAFKHVDDQPWTAGPFEGRPRNEIPTGYRNVVVEDWAERTADDGTLYLAETGEDFIEMHDGTVLNLVPDILDSNSVVENPKWKGWLKDDQGYLRPSWRSLVEVVVHKWSLPDADAAGPDEGDHVLLRFYDADWADEVAPALTSASDLGADIYTRAWTIEFTARSGKTQRSVRCAPMRNQVPELTVESADAESVIETERMRFVNLAVAAYQDAAEAPQEEAKPDFTPESIAYSKMSPQRLKALLTKANIEYGKANHSELVELAKANL